MANFHLGRRDFLRGLSLSGPGFYLAAPDSSRAQESDSPSSEPGFFASEERAILAELADYIYPGSAQLGAVDFIERLLTAMDHSPPCIYESGSGGFLSLNRVQEKAWRIYLYGSEAVGGAPNEAVLGRVTGLRDIIRQGARDALSVSKSTPVGISGWWHALDRRFRETLTELCVQSALANPEYGGNKSGAGWASIHFDGNRNAFSNWDPVSETYIEDPNRPLSTANPVPDPQPMGWFTRLIFRIMNGVAG
jgi:hypothetical protein